MPRSPRSVPAALTLALAAVFALSACTAASPLSGSSPTESASTPGATATATAPGSTGGAAAISAPADCDAVDLKPGAKVAGTDLAACVVGYSRAARSGHVSMSASDGASGGADFVFGDAPSMSGTVTSSDGTTSFVLTPDEAWVTLDGAWVQGDVNSSDPKKMLAGTVGQAYRAFADPSAAASLISAASSWTVQTDQDAVDVPGEGQVQAWRLQSDAPFSALGTQVQDMIVWLSSAHVPVGTQATVSVGGVQTTTAQHFSRWGMPVSIATPQP